jgi:glycosyltransferase involved in cell wall biosynthesis
MKMNSPRVLMVHNYYQLAGGEDDSFEAEADLLERHDHPVYRYTRHNREIKQMGRWAAGAAAVWSRRSRSDLRGIIRDFRPDIVHFQNTFPLVSPAAYGVVKQAGIPVVQSLRNYRTVCLNGVLFRQGRVCVDCVGRGIPWPGVLHRCYRKSRAGSAAVALMITSHRALRTWTSQVDLYISNSEFARRQFVKGGLPADKIRIKPNFVHPDPGPHTGEGEYALFIGRLAAEKGLLTLLRAWRSFPQKKLVIVGDGPLKPQLEQEVLMNGLSGVQLVGWRPREELSGWLRGARFLVFPSEWYETFGRVLVEGLAAGLPVIAARIGAVEEIIEHERTGRLFTPANVDDLAAQIAWLSSHPAESGEMGRRARQAYLERYTADKNYELLLGLYRTLL